jgi:hypothetical protein
MLSTLLGLAMIVEARDPYTGGHLWRVSQFSRLLATEAGLPARDVALCQIGGFLHDLGKIGVPDNILHKPARLSDEERAVVRTHPMMGGRLLADHPLAGLALPVVEGHHERPDGKGYPHGLVGEDIPEITRVVSIADAFDAMTSARPYRAGMPMDKALSIIGDELGSQFDVNLGQHFLSLGQSVYLPHIIGHSEPGIPLQPCPACTAPMVVRSAQRDGEQVYCRVCGSESRLHKHDGTVQLEMTGTRGDAAALAPDSDPDLIGAMVADIGRYVL